jgi:hypothetical protein
MVKAKYKQRELDYCIMLANEYRDINRLKEYMLMFGITTKILKEHSGALLSNSIINKL